MSMNHDKRAALPETDNYEKSTKTKNARKKGKFNIVDAILVLVVLAILVSVLAYFLPGIASYFTREEEYIIT